MGRKRTGIISCDRLDINMDYTEDYENRGINIDIDTNNPRHVELTKILDRLKNN